MLALALCLQIDVDAPNAPDPLAERAARLEALRATEEKRAKSIDQGLAWLLAHQEPDGSWDADGFERHDPEGKGAGGAGAADGDVGATALAALALLGAGAAPGEGAQGAATGRAVAWLRAAEAPADALQGVLLAAALCDAAACGAAPAEEAAAALARAGEAADQRWLLVALRAARDAGVEVDVAALEALELQEAVRLESVEPPKWSSRTEYDCADLLFDAWGRFDEGDLSWSEYRAAWEPVLTRTRRRGGSAKGSWDPDRVGAEAGGRVWATAAMVLAAETGVRSSPFAAPVAPVAEAPGGGRFGNRRGGRNPLRHTNPRLSEALEDAAAWLAAQQHEDGTFGEGEGAMLTTALVLHALMLEGSSTRTGPHAAVVARGVGRLRERLDEDGALRGGDDLAQAVAALVLAEAYQNARSPLLREPALRAVEDLVRRVDAGALRDASGASWGVLALLAGIDADLGLPDRTLDLAAKLYEAGDDGDVGARLFAQVLLESRGALEPDAAATEERAATIVTVAPEWTPGADLEGWFWGAHAAFQLGGAVWRPWDRAVSRGLPDAQQRSGANAGTWSGAGELERATAYGVLTAAVYFRLPSLVGRR